MNSTTLKRRSRVRIIAPPSLLHAPGRFVGRQGIITRVRDHGDGIPVYYDVLLDQVPGEKMIKKLYSLDGKILELIN
mgnify:CR=1 FL=1